MIIVTGGCIRILLFNIYCIFTFFLMFSCTLFLKTTKSIFGVKSVETRQRYERFHPQATAEVQSEMSTEQIHTGDCLTVILSKLNGRIHGCYIILLLLSMNSWESRTHVIFCAAVCRALICL